MENWQSEKARRALAAYQFGRDHGGAGLRDWWRDKRNREIEEARKARRASVVDFDASNG
jgi:hypothetical protein